ncbi:hypothetical protein [uncultured Friedmanniella sp.]
MKTTAIPTIRSGTGDCGPAVPGRPRPVSADALGSADPRLSSLTVGRR